MKHWHLVIILIASLLAVIASIFTFSYFQKGSNEPQNTVNTTIEPKDTAQVPETMPEEPKILESDLDTSTWKTYRNDEFGFEVKYPERILSTSIMDTDGIMLETKDLSVGETERINFSISFFSKNSSGGGWGRRYAFSPETESSQEIVSVGGKKFIKRTVNSAPMLEDETKIVVYLPQDTSMYRVELVAFLPKNNAQSQKLVNSILDSIVLPKKDITKNLFKLPEISPNVAGWKEYKNDDYALSFRYPESLELCTDVYKPESDQIKFGIGYLTLKENCMSLVDFTVRDKLKYNNIYGQIDVMGCHAEDCDTKIVYKKINGENIKIIKNFAYFDSRQTSEEAVFKRGNYFYILSFLNLSLFPENIRTKVYQSFSAL